MGVNFVCFWKHLWEQTFLPTKTRVFCSVLCLSGVGGHWGSLQGKKGGLVIFFQRNWKESNFPQCSEQGLKQVLPAEELDELNSNMGWCRFIHPVARPHLWRAVCVYASQDQMSRSFPGNICVFQHGISSIFRPSRVTIFFFVLHKQQLMALWNTTFLG